MSEGKSRKRRTGRTSPQHPLPEAIRFAQAVREAFVSDAAARKDIAACLGHKSEKGELSGAAGRKIGSMTHFGLLESKGKGQYVLTELAHRILLPEGEKERSHAIAEAAAKPTLYMELLSDFSGQALPSMLGNILTRKYSVSEPNASMVVENFKSTMEFAALLRHGVLHTELVTSETTSGEGAKQAFSVTEKEKAESTGMPPRNSASRSRRDPQSGDHEYEIVLRGNRKALLILPHEFTALDLDKITKWIDFTKEDLTAENCAEEGRVIARNADEGADDQ